MALSNIFPLSTLLFVIVVLCYLNIVSCHETNMLRLMIFNRRTFIIYCLLGISSSILPHNSHDFTTGSFRFTIQSEYVQSCPLLRQISSAIIMLNGTIKKDSIALYLLQMLSGIFFHTHKTSGM